MKVAIRPLASPDRPAWVEMWQQFCAYYRVDLPARVVESTWSRVVSRRGPLFGLLAEDGHGVPIGFCHYVCHPNTWSDQTVCYLEDLFVAPQARRMGVASALIGELTEIGRREGWFRIYWITDEDNLAARAVYDRLATRTPHVRYEIGLS